MPRIATWDELASTIRDHLILRMRDRAIRTADLDWRQLGDALSASGRPLPGIEARTPSDHRERPKQKVASHQLRAWLRTEPAVPGGDWYKDFGSFKICGEGSYPKTFLIAGQAAKGKRL